MTLIRDIVRDKRADRAAKAKELGIDVDALAKEKRHSGDMYNQLDRFGNENIPLGDDSQRLVINDPPSGALDGTNTDYTITEFPIGAELAVIIVRGQTGVAQVLSKTSSAAPAAGSYYLDSGNRIVRLAQADALTGANGDTIIVVFRAAR